MNRVSKQSRLLTFCVDKQWLCLSVDQLSEVVTPQRRTQMPLAPSSVNGLINLRGKILTELDMRTTLSLKPRDPEDRNFRTIILETEEEGDNYGLTVDSVGEVIDMDSDAFEKTPDSLSEHWRRISYGVLKQDKRIVVLVDVEKVLALSLSEVPVAAVAA